MSTSEMLHTLEPMVQKRFSLFRFPIQQQINTDWKARNSIKLRTFLISLTALFGLAVLSAVFIGLPLYITSSGLGGAFIFSIPLMLISSLSWLVPSWLWYDKSKKFMFIVMGLIPMRCLFLLFCLVSAQKIPALQYIPFIMFSVWHWVLFQTTEIWMMYRYTKDLDAVAGDQP